MDFIFKEKTWPLNKPFNISRGSKTEAVTVEVNLRHNDFYGRGECVPYSRYQENTDAVIKQLEGIKKGIQEEIIGLHNLHKFIEPGAARNAIDCALWDLECKKNNKNIWSFMEIPKPQTIKTCYTIVLDTPKAMALDAKSHENYPILKIKVNEKDLHDSMMSIRDAAPNPKIILDANEGLSVQSLDKLSDFLVSMNVSLMEQPISSDADKDLLYFKSPIPLCADESFHSYDDLEDIFKKYQYINIKLDKTGGLTEALKIAKKAKELQKGVMIGCMVGSSLSMLPALTLYEYADYIDLDGPCFLKQDQLNGIKYDEGFIRLAEKMCWG